MRRLICATGLTALIAIAAASTASARPGELNPVFAYNGNEFIIRAQPYGNTVYLRAYRAQGSSVWEPFGTTSIPLALFNGRRRGVAPIGGGFVARIYFTGQFIGYSDVDLDDPYNTLLYRHYGRRGR